MMRKMRRRLVDNINHAHNIQAVDAYHDSRFRFKGLEKYNIGQNRTRAAIRLRRPVLMHNQRIGTFVGSTPEGVAANASRDFDFRLVCDGCRQERSRYILGRRLKIEGTKADKLGRE
jgi:hypothetical protein